MRNSQVKTSPDAIRVYCFRNLTEEQIEEYFIMRRELRRNEEALEQLRQANRSLRERIAAG